MPVPLGLSDLTVWLSAEREAQRRGLSTFDSVLLDLWQDEFGSEASPGQLDPDRRPVLRHDGTRWIVEFDGVDDYLDFTGSGLALFRNVAGMAIAVGVRGADTNRQDILTVRTDQALIVGQIFSRNRGGDGRLEFSGRRLAANTFVTVQSADEQFEDDEWQTQSGTMDFQNRRVRVRINGSVVASDDAFSTSGSTANQNHAGVTIGAESPPTGAVFFFDGAITDLLLFDAAINDATMEEAEGWVAATIAGSAVQPLSIADITDTSVALTGAYDGEEVVQDVQVRILRELNSEVVYGPESLGATPDWPHVATGLPPETDLVPQIQFDEDVGGLSGWINGPEFMSRPKYLTDPSVPELRGRSAAWSFNRPRGARYVGDHDRTYWATVALDSSLNIYSVDHTTGATRKAVLRPSIGLADSHNSPVVRVRADGRVQVFVSGHNLPLYLFTSLEPEDVTAWDDGVQLADEATYPEVLTLSDRVVLHYRAGDFDGWTRAYMESTDDGDTWGEPVTLIEVEDQRPYMHVAKHPESDRIDYLVNSGHLNESTASLYHFYQVGSEFFKSDGTLIGDLDDLPFAPSDGTVIWDAAAEGVEALGWDIAFDRDNRPHAAFITVPGASGHIARHARWDGSQWLVNTIAAVGGTIIPGGGSTEAHVSAGLQLDPLDDTRAWVCIESESGSIAQLNEAITEDRGETWSLTVHSEGEKDTYPAVPHNRHPDLAVLFLRGAFDAEDDFSTQALSLGIEQDQPPGPPNITAPSDGQEITIGSTTPVAWEPAADPDGDDLQYEGDLWNGSEWVQLFALQPDLSFAWDTTGLEERSDYRIRVRAHDGTEYGEYDETGPFSLVDATWTQCDEAGGSWDGCDEAGGSWISCNG